MKTILAILTMCALHAAELKFGKPLELKQTLRVDELMAKPESFVGKPVQVKGKITEVCQMMGCWMMLTNGDAAVRLQVEHGKIEFPKDAAGKSAVAEGVFEKFELTKEEAIAEAKHEAEEQGRPFNPESVKGPMTIYQIHGTGAVITD